jgi:hypothetical protein
MHAIDQTWEGNHTFKLLECETWMFIVLLFKLLLLVYSICQLPLSHLTSACISKMQQSSHLESCYPCLWRYILVWILVHTLSSTYSGYHGIPVYIPLLHGIRWQYIPVCASMYQYYHLASLLKSSMNQVWQVSAARQHGHTNVSSSKFTQLLALGVAATCMPWPASLVATACSMERENLRILQNVSWILPGDGPSVWNDCCLFLDKMVLAGGYS